jgi:ribosomal protein S18 acetylase RimI-like enzyme
MKFELTEALLDDILFSMEDQNCEFWLDTVEGVVAGGPEDLDFYDIALDEDDGEGGPRYISLPDWNSASGFRLMEHFAAGSKNAALRKELSNALNQGKGVFRAFKNALARYPEAEKLWYVYKEKKMKREIISWYNGLREEWGLEEIGLEPEETGDLVLEDFVFRPFQEKDILQAEELHRQCIEECRSALAESPIVNGIMYEEGISAVHGDSELAGYVSGQRKGRVFYVKNLEVKAVFRGLGIGEKLLARMLESLDTREIDQVLLDLPSWVEGFSKVLCRESFKPYLTRYRLKLKCCSV